MRPYVICHMGISVDGRIIPRRWSPMPEDGIAALTADYEAIHEQLGGEAWLVGRKTLAEFARGTPRPGLPTAGIDRGNHFATRGARGYAIGIDASGKSHYQQDTANGNHIVAVLSQTVGDAYLAELRASGISYIFAGDTAIDLKLALDILARELSIETLLLEGGGSINGAFLKAGLIDELSLMIAPAVDGLMGTAALFDFPGAPDERPENLVLTLKSVEQRQHGFVWLRYGFSYPEPS